MTEREALKLALDAFGEIAWSNETQWQKDRAKEAITIIKEALAQPEHDYERGFIDGMQKQMQSSVDKAVNRLAQRTWVGLTDEEIKDCFKITPDQHLPWHIYQRIEAKLKEKNNA